MWQGGDERDNHLRCYNDGWNNGTMKRELHTRYLHIRGREIDLTSMERLTLGIITSFTIWSRIRNPLRLIPILNNC